MAGDQQCSVLREEVSQVQTAGPPASRRGWLGCRVMALFLPPRARALLAGLVPSVAVGVAECHRIPSHVMHTRMQVVGFLGGVKVFFFKPYAFGY